jgi:hypothetical protein
LVWHFYNVHVKSLNKAMFTGKMSPHQMEEEHGEELERLLAGKVRPAPNPEGVRRRERIFIPFAVVATLVMVLAVYLLATAEKTAVASVPLPATVAPVFAPLTPTPVPSVTVDNSKIGKPIPHPIAGQEKCDTCHAAGGIKPMPANHEGRPVDSCQVCHAQGPTPTPGGSSAGGPKAIPADHDLTSTAYKDCTLCHGAGKLKPFPENHASFTADSCTGCHKQATAADATPEASAQPTASGPKAIPANHDLTSAAYKDCTLCHGAGKLKPFPENHASYTADICTGCHKQATAGVTPQATVEPVATVED